MNQGEAKLTWQCLEKCKNFLFASSFNLYYSCLIFKNGIVTAYALGPFFFNVIIYSISLGAVVLSMRYHEWIYCTGIIIVSSK
jgi:hypothetical protein